MEFNYLLESRAVTRVDGRYAIDYARIPAVVAQLARELLEIEATGDRPRAENWFAKYDKIPADLEKALAATKDIPVDIDPVFSFKDDVRRSETPSAAPLSLRPLESDGESVRRRPGRIGDAQFRSRPENSQHTPATAAYTTPRSPLALSRQVWLSPQGLLGPPGSPALFLTVFATRDTYSLS